MNGQQTLGKWDHLAFSAGDVRFSIAEHVTGLTLDQLDQLARWIEDYDDDVIANYRESDEYQDIINGVDQDSYKSGHDMGWEDAMSKAEDVIGSIFDDLGEALDGADEDDTYQALYDRVCEVWESRKARLEAL